jgi:hypothetical protein
MKMVVDDEIYQKVFDDTPTTLYCSFRFTIVNDEDKKLIVDIVADRLRENLIPWFDYWGIFRAQY